MIFIKAMKKQPLNNNIFLWVICMQTPFDYT